LGQGGEIQFRSNLVFLRRAERSCMKLKLVGISKVLILQIRCGFILSHLDPRRNSVRVPGSDVMRSDRLCSLSYHTLGANLASTLGGSSVLLRSVDRCYHASDLRVKSLWIRVPVDVIQRMAELAQWLRYSASQGFCSARFRSCSG